MSTTRVVAPCLQPLHGRRENGLLNGLAETSPVLDLVGQRPLLRDAARAPAPPGLRQTNRDTARHAPKVAFCYTRSIGQIVRTIDVAEALYGP